MARQVVHRVALRGEGGVDLDPYKERLLKLIPAETVAVYVSLQGVLLSALAAPEKAARLDAWLWTIFVSVLVLNALYLRNIQKVVDWKQHAIVATAFVVWAFTLGGPFQRLSFYEPFMGSVALLLFTFAVPIFYRGLPVES
jgi:hypothetical protein